MSTVLKPWVEAAPWKMQSILLSGLRAPDAPTKVVKKICRWMRALSQNNADPSKGYMEAQDWHSLARRVRPEAHISRSEAEQVIIEACMDELEYLPCHYVHHFADALRVVALYYPLTGPDGKEFPLEQAVEHERVYRFADALHREVAQEIFHFHPESDDEFVERHRDKVEHE